ncbi:MAG: tetratricopeptide repeat protein [Phycisphaerae bacterium]
MVIRIAVLALSVFLVARPTFAQTEPFRERQELDPDSNDWVAREAATQPVERTELDEARRLLAEGKPGDARKLLEAWLTAHRDDERSVEAHALMGDALFELGDFYAAYESYERAAEAGSGDLFYRALSREMDVARAFLSGQKRRFWGIFRIAAYDDGIKILDRVWERVPGTRMGEQALRLKADYFFGNGDMDLAQDEYAGLAREYPSGRYIQMALLRSAESADASYPGVGFNDQPLVEADERYKQLQDAFPIYADRQRIDERREGIRRQRADADLSIAKWYEHVKQRGAAEFYYRRILKDWPDTLAAAEARSRLRALGVEVEQQESGK